MPATPPALPQFITWRSPAAPLAPAEHDALVADLERLKSEYTAAFVCQVASEELLRRHAHAPPEVVVEFPPGSGRPMAMGTLRRLHGAQAAATAHAHNAVANMMRRVYGGEPW